MADIEGFLQLYDFHWFENGILGSKTKPSSSTSTPGPDVHVEVEEEMEASPLMKLSQTPSFVVRSYSDQALSSKDVAALVGSDYSPSPRSVLRVPKLETILSGKEVGESRSEPEARNSNSEGGKLKRRGIRGGKTGSRSLSELEFEELKGFMDLGFVFSEEDKGSRLASIIPGLQRLGKRGGREVDEDGNALAAQSTVARPYLSEAWEASNDVKMKNQLMNWRISATGQTDLEIKNQIRFWAHTVASTVR